MNSAYLKYPISIYEITIITTDFGTVREGEPVLKCNTRAHILFNSENKVVSEGEIFYDTSRTFVVRAYIPVNERDRILYEGEWWNIISKNKNIYHNNIELLCTKKNQ